MPKINVVLYEPEIPQNTGNIIRTCMATNAKLHIIKPMAFDLHHKLMKRAGAGRTIDEIEHEIHESYEAFVAKYGSKKIFYITRYGQHVYANQDFKGGEEVWMMFGTESTGIPRRILQTSLETCLRIPMSPNERSLNLANTVMLLVYEVCRQNNFEGLSEFEVQKGKNFILGE